ncbi:hypothetical protein GCM10010429_20720 [Micromonospora olivasterospora]|uniref:Uncharacterized protein n=1 Tax=Micromonospora olivasterospora TaxID=1880 RepID=A0A562IH70_MICOL|nr:hypothetical protein JD77_05394 [Micromonospora olivasterospora]
MEFREAYFSPTSAGQKPALLNKLCAGVEVKIVDRAAYDPIRADVADVVGAWADELAAFDRQRRPYLLY